jgi:hypothetical protein
MGGVMAYRLGVARCLRNAHTWKRATTVTAALRKRSPVADDHRLPTEGGDQLLRWQFMYLCIEFLYLLSLEHSTCAPMCGAFHGLQFMTVIHMFGLIPLCPR